MTSSQIRQSFLDFFKSKEHTIVPSSSLMPDSPNLLFTNAGMNQFVPIFLGQQPCPYSPPRAADTQKCIRAGGKHNDLEDVGLDTYHHTFFEMLGNWSFGNYFKKEAIEWAWELITEVWKFPRNRLYATVYSPDKSKGDPSEFDQEAYNFWAAKFEAAGLDPKVHIVYGNKKDNFWMMGETGPCGPCSEIHVDLTPNGDTKGELVNKGSPKCIEIWNLVFIQFNANPDGTFTPLPARHVDTGMGFERVTAIIQCTKGFTDFTGIISNYETDVFRPIFDRLEKMSGKRYTSTLPPAGSTGETEQEKIDVAFRVIADHIRTLSFSIADGILPGNNDRNYVLRRILRRAVKYSRTLGFQQPFFYQLVDVLVETMGTVFPEVGGRRELVKTSIQTEEESFNKTLDAGLQIFDQLKSLHEKVRNLKSEIAAHPEALLRMLESEFPFAFSFEDYGREVIAIANPVASANPILWQKVCSNHERTLIEAALKLNDLLTSFYNFPETHTHKKFFQESVLDIVANRDLLHHSDRTFWGSSAFLLYDTYGFPLDLTELMARERGLAVDISGFAKLMDEQRSRARASQKKEVISVTHVEAEIATQFVGYNELLSEGKVVGTQQVKDRTAILVDRSPFYAEMGGQVGDTGSIELGAKKVGIINTQKIGNYFLHIMETDEDTILWGNPFPIGDIVSLHVNRDRRNAIQRHHTVTHLFHWALHEVVSNDALQKGSYVGPEKLTFDFNNAALTPQQVRDVERLVNEKIVENGLVSWTEIPYSEVKNHKDITHLFGEKYGDRVRVVQIGGESGKFNGYSMELCGGTHTRGTGEIGFFRIVAESAIAAGVRRVEAVAGLAAYDRALQHMQLLQSVSGKLNTPVAEIDKKIDALLAHQKELEKQLKALQQKQAAETGRTLLSKAVTIGTTPALIANLGQADGDYLQAIAESLKGQFKGVLILGGHAEGNASLVATVSPEYAKQFQSGKIIQTIAPLVGGKGGGRPDFARGGGKDPSKLDDALSRAAELIRG